MDRQFIASLPMTLRVGAVGMLVATVGMLIAVHPLLGFALAVLVAAGWCAWLER